MLRIIRSRTSLLLILILAIAIFFRLWQISSVPPGLYPDEAINGNDALTALENSNFKVFYPENNGREGLFINLIAISFSIFGVSIWSIKIVPALFGILTVLGIYLLTKEILQNTSFKSQATSIALLSSFFLAVSFWHINFSRIAFRGILVPFLLVFGLFFLFRAFRTKKLSDFIAASIFWGLGFYTYISFRMAVIILAAFLILKFIEYLKQTKTETKLSWIWNKLYVRDGWWKVNVFLLLIFLIALPIGIYFLQNPGDFMGRAAGVSVFKQDSPINATLISFFRHLIMFFSFGDNNWRHNIAGNAVMIPLLGILMYLGIFVGVEKIIKAIRNKNWQESFPYLILLIWFFAMLLPGVLTYEGIPHSLRVIGAIPPAYIFSAIGVFSLKRPLENLLFSDFTKKYGPLILIWIVIIAVGLMGYWRYFICWANNPNVEGAFTKKFADIGYYLNSLPPNTAKYVIVNEPGVPVPWPDGSPMPAQTVMFIENTKFGRPQSAYLLPEKLDQVKIEKKTAILPMECNEKILAEFQKRWPEGSLISEKEICIYKIGF